MTESACAGCGRPRAGGEGVCPECERPSGAEGPTAAAPPAPAPTARRGRWPRVGARAIVLGALGAAALVVPLFGPSAASTSGRPTAPPDRALPCERAIAAVEARHATLFPMLTSAAAGQFSCGGTNVADERVVRFSWLWQGQPRTAEYAVGRAGGVVAVDAFAKRIDTVAPYGQLALKMLVGS